MSDCHLHSPCLSGANMIHDVGYIEVGNTGSPQQAVMMDEVIDMVSIFFAGFP